MKGRLAFKVAIEFQANGLMAVLLVWLRSLFKA